MKNSISIFICQLTCVVHLSFKNLFNFALTHHTFFILFFFFLIDVLPLNAWFAWNLWLVLFAICWSSFSCQLNNLSKRRKQQQYVEKKKGILKALDSEVEPKITRTKTEVDDDDAQKKLNLPNETCCLLAERYAIESNYRRRLARGRSSRLTWDWRRRRRRAIIEDKLQKKKDFFLLNKAAQGCKSIKVAQQLRWCCRMRAPLHSSAFPVIECCAAGRRGQKKKGIRFFAGKVVDNRCSSQPTMRYHY